MQVPANANQGPDEGYKQDSRVANQALPGMVLTINSQLRLRELYQYLDRCRTLLDEINADLSLVESEAGGDEIMKRCTKKMNDFCLEADAWGFDDLYGIAWRLQMLFLNSGGGGRDISFGEALRGGLALLSSLLDQCENDFRRRLAVGEMIARLDLILHA